MTKLREAQAFGRAIATNLFAAMLNPKQRGPAFRWELLEDLAVLRAGAQFGLHVVCSPEEASSLLRIAKEEAGVQVRMLLRESGVQEWLPLPQAG